MLAVKTMYWLEMTQEYIADDELKMVEYESCLSRQKVTVIALSVSGHDHCAL